MVKVFIFGATGFIGSAVARSLRTQGHRVYGLVRSDSKASQIVKEEIIPVLGEAENTDVWTSALEKLHIDVVVDCSGVMQGAMDILKACAAVSKKRIDTFGEGREKAAKMGFVYVSGMWVHGDSKEYGNDLSPVGENAPVKPAALVAWRVNVETELLRQSRVLNGVVLRAGLMFGGSGSFIGAVWWSAIHAAIGKGDKSVELAGKEDTILGLVHKDDFGQAVVKTVEKIELISQSPYPVYDIVACNEALTQINTKAAQFLAVAAGSPVPNISYRAPSNIFEDAMTASSGISNDRARDVINWAPRHTSLLGDMEIYVESFRGAATATSV